MAAASPASIAGHTTHHLIHVYASPSVTFLSFPQEIRDNIYVLALVSSSPIVVWKGEWVSEPSTSHSNDSVYISYADFASHASYVWRRAIDQLASKISLYSLSTNLLYCCKTISQEAAMVFYQKNTFSFLGEHNWDPIVSWLETIGAQNRDHLTNLTITAYSPDQVWQRLNGERSEHPGGYTREVIYPRNSHFHVRMPLFKYGLVDNINPALQTMFQLLGSRTSAWKLTLKFDLRDEYPGQGAIVEDEDQHPENSWYSMDLPNLVEKFRTLYTCRQKESKTESSIDVLWKSKCPLLISHRPDGVFSRIAIMDHVKNIEDHGWEIEISSMVGDDSVLSLHQKSCNIPIYVLRRKGLDEPLVANEPNPHSGRYITQEREEFDLERINEYYS